MSGPVVYGMPLYDLIAYLALGAWVVWFIHSAFFRQQKPVVFYVHRRFKSGASESRYTYYREDSLMPWVGSLEAVAMEIRLTTDRLLASKEYPPPFVIRFVPPSGHACITWADRMSKAIFDEPLSPAERQQFWLVYQATPLSAVA